ncbi:MAG TPA: hypothetical protein VI980_09065 [Acidimicrobiia bacterium]|nr:hypothetical protein [Acidimicrobiia bacterium]
MGVLLVAAVLALTSCNGGAAPGTTEQEPGVGSTTAPSGDPATTAGQPATSTTSSVTLDLCGLVEPAEADEALGEFVTGIANTPAGCQFETDSGAYVLLEYGSPEDFLEGAQIEGVTGETVPGIEDQAVWFATSPGVLSVRVEDAYFHIVVDLPNGDGAAQLEVATNFAAIAAVRAQDQIGAS